MQSEPELGASGDGRFDHDVLVIGSGFGGSVAALRLAEKGYRVHVLEAGRRFADHDLPETSWDLRKYLWAPKLGCFGVQRIHRLPNVVVLAGAGVGGGSLNYAQTLYVPPKAYFEDPQWSAITDWQSELEPHYDRAAQMLGATQNPCDGPVEQAMLEAAEDLGVQDTYRKTNVGVFFGKPGVRVPDPYFGGAGPERTGCTECGNCMVGCRVGAKNTLPKNYLALAENLGVTIEPLRTVVRLGTLPGGGYRVMSERTGAWLRPERRVETAAQVVVAAGTWGTQKLLHAMNDTGELKLSPTLGRLTRTNSEALLGATLMRVPHEVDLTHGVAITSSFHPEPQSHIENVRYGKGSNAMGTLASIAVPGDTGRPRPVEFLMQAVRHPLQLLRMAVPHRWSERVVIGLVMQALDNSITVSGRRTLTGGRGLTSKQGHGKPNPTYLPVGQHAMNVFAKRMSEVSGHKAHVGNSVSDIFDVPMTAHFLGGAAISADPEQGVIDPYQRVWGYPGLTVADGAAVSANLGVNPSLTITAQAERAFSLWPNKGQADPRPAQGEAYRRVEPVAPQHSAVPGPKPQDPVRESGPLADAGLGREE